MLRVSHKPSNRGDATSRIWASFQAGVRRLVLRKVSATDDVDDIVQDIFVRIHTGAEQIRDSEKVESWVFGIARRAIADYYRAEYRKPETETLESGMTGSWGDEQRTASVGEHEGDHTVHEEVLSWLEPTIKHLPEKYARAVRLSDIEGRSQKEIASELGLSYTATKSRIQRGRKMVSERIKDCCQVEFGGDGQAVEFRRRGKQC